MLTSFKKQLLKISFIFMIFSIVFCSVTLIIAKPSTPCYFCLNAGTPQNECAEASGSGWTICERGNLYCAFGGSACINDPS